MPSHAPFTSILSKHGFTSAEPEANGLLDNIVHNLVSHTLDNAVAVIKACNCKTLKPSHFELMANVFVSKSGSATQTQSGGRIVHASEYYGIDSGSYYEDVSGSETVMSEEPVDGIARPSLDVMLVGGGCGGGGAAALLAKSYIARHIKHKNVDARLSAGAKAMIHDIVEANVNKLLAAVAAKHKSKKTELTAATLQRVLGTKPFKHMVAKI